jgi:MucB/RseB N-terminal domain
MRLPLLVRILAVVGLTFIVPPSVLGQSAPTRSSPRPFPRIALEDTLSGDIPGAFVTTPPLPVPIGARLFAALDTDENRLHERLSRYRERQIPVWLALPIPATLGAVPAWRAKLRSVIARHAEGISILELFLDGQDPQLAAYVVRLAATEVRAERESVHIALGGARFDQAPARLRFFSPDLAPYVDLLALPLGSNIASALADMHQRDPTARLVVTGAETGSDRDQAVQRLTETELDAIGTDVVSHAWQPSAAFEQALRNLTPLAPLIAGDISPLDPSAASLRLSIAGRDVTASLKHRLLFDGRTFATYLVCWPDAAPEPLHVSLTLPVEGVPAVYRLADSTKVQAADYSRNQESGLVNVNVPRPGGPILVDFNEAASEVFMERSNVSAERSLTVDEIIARHQQQQRTQDALLHNYIARARMEQHFRPTMTDPGYDVVTDNRYYVADDGVEWEELSFSVNGSRWGSDRPPFPLLQAEKVLSLPLQLRFDSHYNYRLAGRERISDRDCYVIRFEPNVNDQSLYRGTLWIDRRTFARIQVQAVQTNLSAPVVSNEETQTYAPVGAIGNRPVFLFTGLDARQIMLIAGRNLLVEKRVTFSDFHLNDERFADARIEARRSNRIMYRETDRGLRYYVKDGDTRVVSERATRTARAMAMGVTLDPSYGFPLPIFGINYLNFEFMRRTDTQLAMLFAGVLAAGNVQRTRLGGTPVDASVDFFAIAVPSSDRLYDANGERDAERLLTWPLSTGANFGWQYSPFQKLSGQYQFRFDGYARDRTTSETYQVPASTITNGFGAGWDYRRAGYSVVLNGTWFARAGWREWGAASSTEDVEPRYVKYSASVSRDFYFNVFHKIHLNAAWFGGRNLDRFSKYQFGMFDDTRIHGVPASGVRFEELAAFRGAYSFNVFEQYRLDLFLEHARGRDRAFDDQWQAITGFGTAINFRAPWHTILRADFGKSLLPDRYSGAGSATLQILLLKPLR